MGKGGEGEVWATREKGSASNHVVKIMTKQNVDFLQLDNELELIIQAAHENVMDISSVFWKDDDQTKELCYSMKIIKSGDLVKDLFFHELTPIGIELRLEFVEWVFL